MERIVLRHLSGTKANQVEEFPLSHFKELSIGRDPSSTVNYDADKDDLVGRTHARIVRAAADSTDFSITDLGSRNGTFVNKQRIVGTARITPGDVVQLGPGGPEFQFDLEPRQNNGVRPTRIAANAIGGLPPTRESSSSGVVKPPAQPVAASNPADTSRVGKATVERMIAQTKGESRKATLVALGGMLLVVAIISAALMYKARVDSQRTEQQIAQRGQATNQELAKMNTGLKELHDRTAPMRPDEIAAAYGKAVVYIEMSWRLVDTMNGSQVYHQFIPNQYKDKNGKVKQIIPDQEGQPAPAELAAYIKVGDEEFEPLLGYDPAHGRGISGAGSGSGFVVSSDGFVITNRHVAAGWRVNYEGWKDALPGVLVDQNGTPETDDQGRPIAFDSKDVLEKYVGNWIPSDSKQKGTKYIGEPTLEGRDDYLNVSFPDTENRKQADLKAISDRHDVALIKIDVPQPLPKVDIYDSWGTTKSGDAVVVLGYPGLSPMEVVVVGSKAPRSGDPLQQMGILPNPTLSAGYVSRVLRSQDGPGKDMVFSSMGDTYQMTINSTGHGNSGGPVFDSFGRVIAIFTYGWSASQADFGFSAAVPIRFAKELMGIQPSR